MLLKIINVYLYCYLFFQGLSIISFNCVNIKCSVVLNKSYFREEYFNLSICSLKYIFLKEEESDFRYKLFFFWFNLIGLKFIGMIYKFKIFEF